MKRIALLSVCAVLAAVVLTGVPGVQAQGQARIDFINNTSTPLSFYANGAYQCRIFVQYGTCSGYVQAGGINLEAWRDDGSVGVTDYLATEAGNVYTWTITEN